MPLHFTADQPDEWDPGVKIEAHPIVAVALILAVTLVALAALL